MSRHRRFILLAMLALAVSLACAGLGGGLSLEEATELVLAEVVKPDELDHQVIVFSMPDPLTPEDSLQTYMAADLEGPGEAYALENEAWFFFIDDAPGAGFAHPTRFVFVDRSTKEISSFDEEWWPILNDTSLWTETDVYWDESNWAYSNVDWRPSRLGLTFSPHMLAKLVNRTFLANRIPGAGLVVNGWDEGQTLKEDMQDNAGDMLTNLFNSDFDAESLGPPADRGIPGRIRNWILDQSQVLQPSQTALIYITGHGSVDSNQNGYVKVGQEWLSEQDLADWLGMFDPGVHVVVIVDMGITTRRTIPTPTTRAPSFPADSQRTGEKSSTIPHRWRRLSAERSSSAPIYGKKWP